MDTHTEPHNSTGQAAPVKYCVCVYCSVCCCLIRLVCHFELVPLYTHTHTLYCDLICDWIHSNIHVDKISSAGTATSL